MSKFIVSFTDGRNTTMLGCSLANAASTAKTIWGRDVVVGVIKLA